MAQYSFKSRFLFCWSRNPVFMESEGSSTLLHKFATETHSKNSHSSPHFHTTSLTEIPFNIILLHMAVLPASRSHKVFCLVKLHATCPLPPICTYVVHVPTISTCSVLSPLSTNRKAAHKLKSSSLCNSLRPSCFVFFTRKYNTHLRRSKGKVRPTRSQEDPEESRYIALLSL
jgi:hypothetical protein